jgi:hypothetical protein
MFVQDSRPVTEFPSAGGVEDLCFQFARTRIVERPLTIGGAAYLALLGTIELPKKPIRIAWYISGCVGHVPAPTRWTTEVKPVF